MKLPKYVQAWVDREGRAHHYFRWLPARAATGLAVVAAVHGRV
jgi:hypothetical protein